MQAEYALGYRRTSRCAVRSRRRRASRQLAVGPPPTDGRSGRFDGRALRSGRSCVERPATKPTRDTSSGATPWQRAVILGGARTPFGKLGGGARIDYGGRARRNRDAARYRALGRRSRRDIEHVIMGQVLQGGAGQIPSRQAASSRPRRTVTSETINRVCGSGHARDHARRSPDPCR